MISLFRGIGRRIFLSFTTLIIVLTLAFSYVGIKFAEKSATENARNELRVLSITLNQQITRSLKRYEATVKQLAATGGFIDAEMQKTKPSAPKLNRFLSERLGHMPHLLKIAVFDTQGICVASTDPDWLGVPGQREPFFINGLRRFSYGDIYEVLTEVAGTTSNPESYLEQEKVMLLSQPVNDPANVHGVIVGQVNLDVLYELMAQELAVKGNAEAFLLDSKLRFITPSKFAPEVSLESHLASTPLTKHLDDEFWVDRYQNYHGIEVLGTVSRIPTQNWYLVIERDFSVVQQQVKKVRDFLVTSTLSLLVLLIFTTFFLTSTITKPIQRLAEGAQRVGAGHVDTPFHVPKGNDEISILAQEFDRMRVQVAQAQGILRARLEKSEQRRIQNERLAAIGALASSLAHEIRNPLNGMNLLLSQFERPAPSPAASSDRQKQYVQSMRSEIARLDRLVNDILDYAKPFHLKSETLNLTELVREVVRLYEPVCASKNLKLSDAMPPQVFVDGDRDKLKQALVNLVQNAIEATSPGGNIGIRVQIKDQTVNISISDNGIGIAQQSRERLFDLFYTTKQSGTGLGLSTVKKIVDAHFGEISFQSDGPGRGTVARIDLPLSTKKSV